MSTAALGPLDETITIADLTRDPYPIYKRLRREAPVLRVKSVGRTFLTKAADTKYVKDNAALFSSNDPNTPMKRAFLAHTLMRKDHDEHRTERMAMMPALMPKTIESVWAPLYAKLAAAYLDRLPREPFLLFVGDLRRVKGVDVLLRAYCRAFRRSEPVVLVLKADNHDITLDVRAEVARLDLPRDHPPIVLLENHQYPEAALAGLYRSADCFVLASRGEGFGLPYLEAMACGLPVIGTDWSGQRELLGEGWSYPLRVKRLIDAHDKCPYYEGFRWADPDVKFDKPSRLLRPGG